jgi:hypothetical protein
MRQSDHVDETTGERSKTTRDESDFAVELFVQSVSPGPGHSHQDSVIEALTALATDGLFDAPAVHVWGDQLVADSVTVTHTETGKFLHERLESFWDWAASSGVSLEPMFGRRTVRSEMTGESYRALSVPTVTLAEYTDGALTNVTPHVADGHSRTVSDRLAALADATSTNDASILTGPLAGDPNDPDATGTNPIVLARK